MNWRSIRKNLQRIKQNTENSQEIIFVIIIIFVGFTSFGLGRLSVLESTREPVRIIQTSQTNASVQRASLDTGGKVVASRYGSKYHAPWCSGANRISEKNKIWFKNEEAAKKAGYTPASNCKGLR